MPVDPGEITESANHVSKNKADNGFIEFKSDIVRYGVEFSGKAQVSLYDLKGCLICNLVDTHHEAGVFSVKIDRKLPSGTYVLTLKSEKAMCSTRMISM
jgi:hypothetical protein